MRAISSFVTWVVTFLLIFLLIYKYDSMINPLIPFEFNRQDIKVILITLSISIRVIILINREIFLSRGHKVAPGIFTLLFLSVIGGILTFLIPRDEIDLDELPIKRFEKTERNAITNSLSVKSLSESWDCPNCFTENYGTLKCKECGYKIEVNRTEYRRKTKQQKKTKTKTPFTNSMTIDASKDSWDCPICFTNNSNTLRCSGCGYLIKQEEKKGE